MNGASDWPSQDTPRVVNGDVLKKKNSFPLVPRKKLKLPLASGVNKPVSLKSDFSPKDNMLKYPIDILSSNSEHIPMDNSLSSLEVSRDETGSADGEDMFSNGYLTPTDPPLYSDSDVKCGSSLSTGSGVSTFRACSPLDSMNGKAVMRLDSGLGGSTSSYRGSESSKKLTISPGSTPASSAVWTSGSSQRLSTQHEQPYEDIDHYHQILGLPHGSCRQQCHGSSPACSPELVDTYAKLGAGSNPDSSSGWTRVPSWLVAALILLLVLSLAALAISVRILLLGNLNCDVNCFEASNRFNQSFAYLQETVQDLRAQNQMLIRRWETHQTNITDFVQALSVGWSRLENLSSAINFLDVKIDLTAKNISLTPGPRGLPGGLDFSPCLNKSMSMSEPASATEPTLTTYLPSQIDVENYFPTFAYCTYNGAQGAQLETMTDIQTSRQRYRCRCWGLVPGASRTLCTITAWMCPQEAVTP